MSPLLKYYTKEEAPMFPALLRLKALGLCPNTVLDIGAAHSTWTLLCEKVFPEAVITQVDPIKYQNSTYEFHQVILADQEKEVDWYELKNTGDSFLKETTYWYKDCLPQKRKTTTLDILFPDRTFNLIKMDVQGAELLILQGGEKLIQTTSIIILEMPFMGEYNKGAPTFIEYINYMYFIGFIPLDIAELHYWEEKLLSHIDMVFIRKEHPLVSGVQVYFSNLGR